MLPPNKTTMERPVRPLVVQRHAPVNAAFVPDSYDAACAAQFLGDCDRAFWVSATRDPATSERIYAGSGAHVALLGFHTDVLWFVDLPPGVAARTRSVHVLSLGAPVAFSARTAHQPPRLEPGWLRVPVGGGDGGPRTGAKREAVWIALFLAGTGTPDHVPVRVCGGDLGGCAPGEQEGGALERRMRDICAAHLFGACPAPLGDQVRMQTTAAPRSRM